VLATWPNGPAVTRLDQGQEPALPCHAEKAHAGLWSAAEQTLGRPNLRALYADRDSSGGRIMRDALSEIDRYQGDASSLGNLRDCPPPRRSGQLDDYYPLIALAVNRLEQSTAETRGTIYDRARAAMGAQLRGMTPPLSESDINGEQLALERALRKVETESLRRAYAPREPSIRETNAPRRPTRETGGEQGEMSNVDGLPRYVPRPPSSMNILAKDENQADDFGKKLAMANPDLSAELEILQREIRRDRRSSLMIRKLVPLTIMGLLIIAASGAY
jgi:hypothetical protein